MTLLALQLAPTVVDMMSRLGLSGRVTMVLATSTLVAGAVVWFGLLQKDQTALPQPPQMEAQTKTERVLVAAHTVVAGTQVTPAGYTFTEMAADQVHDGFLVDSPANQAALAVLTVARTVPSGTPFVAEDLMPPETAVSGAEPQVHTSASALRLTEGMRAIALPVTAETSVAGLIRNGDRVDIMLSYALEDDLIAIRTVLRNVRIIATDQIPEQAPESEPVEPKAPPKIVTFELTPDGAKVLVLAQKMGDLMLVLSGGEEGNAPIIADDTPIFSSQISGETTKPLPPINSRSVAVVRGAESRMNVLTVADAIEPGEIGRPQPSSEAAIVAVPSIQGD